MPPYIYTKSKAYIEAVFNVLRGGTTNQVLKKNSGVDFAFSWQDESTGTAFTGGTLTSPLVLSGDATASLNPVTLQQWQTKRWKPPARFATTAALPAYTATTTTLTANANGAFPTTDGQTPALGDRVLVLFEGTGATAPAIGGSSVNNGLYTITQLGTGSLPWILTRDVWADTSAKVMNGMMVWVTQGTINGQVMWNLITADPITLGTTALQFAQTIQAGTGLTRTRAVLATNFGAAAGTVTQGNDSRLSDARTPTAHASTHLAGGSDALAMPAYYKFSRAGSTVATITGSSYEPVIEARTLTALYCTFGTAPTAATTISLKRRTSGNTITEIATISHSANARDGSTTGLSVALAAGDSLRADVTAGGTAGADLTVVAKAT